MSSSWEIGVRVFAGLAMIGLAVALAIYLRCRSVATWKPYRAGACCFVASQVVHVPFNIFVLTPAFAVMDWDLTTAAHDSSVTLVAMALALGLSAGICEETTRWSYFRYICRSSDNNDSSSYNFAFMVGAGHGGCEAILAGYIALMTVVGMSFLKAHPDKIPSGEQHDAVTKAITDYWAASTGQVLMAPVERIWAMTFHLAASILVWQAATRARGTSQDGRQPASWYYYYGAAVAFHTLLDAAAVFCLMTWGVYAVELCLGLTAFPLSCYILWYYYYKHSNLPVLLPLQQQPTGVVSPSVAPGDQQPAVDHDEMANTCSEEDPLVT